MSKAKYKYNLSEFLERMPRAWTVERLSEEVLKYGISRRTFDRDKSITVKDIADIPGERLFIYSRLINCSIDQLINFDIKVKPITN